MQRLFSTILTILACAVVAGCAAAGGKSDTYANIKAEMAKAAEASKQTTQMDSVADALLPPVKMTLPKARAPLEERFSVSYKNLPAQQFFNAIVAGTRYNMLVSPEVAGNISLSLKDVTLFDVLDAARDVYGYEYRVEGTRIYVQALTLQTRLFHINYLTAVRKSASDIRVASTSLSANNNNNSTNNNGSTTNNNNSSNSNNSNGTNNTNSNSTTTDSSRISTTTNTEFWLDLKAALEAIVPKQEGRSVVVSQQSGVVLVKAMPDELRNVAAYLKAAQLSVDRQVIIEAKILEVQLNDSYQTGINWSAFASGTNSALSIGMVGAGTTLSALTSTATTMTTSAGLSSVAGSTLANTGTSSLFGLAFKTSNFAAMLNFLETQGTVHVMSSPRVAAMNNQPAVFKVGSEEPYVTGVSTTTTTNTSGTNTVSPSVTMQSYFSGVVLDVTPQIDDRGNISLHVHPSVIAISAVTKTIDLGDAGTLSLPMASSSTSEADTVVRGQDGQIVALGGLMRESSTGDSSQLPGVGDVPLLGSLFRSTDKTNQKRELVVLIKPTIVKEGDTSWSEDIFSSNQRMRNLEPKDTQSKEMH